MTLFDILSARVSVKQTSRRNGGEFHSLCLKCGGEDRFMFWPEAGNFYCRGCGWRGDSITVLREIDGLSFREAAARVGKELPENDIQRARRKREVKERLLGEYFLFYHRKLDESCTAFRELVAEIEAAEIGYRAIVRQPDLYTEEEKDYWEQFLGKLYDTLPAVEHDCDLLTYEKHLQERFAWWEEERGE